MRALAPRWERERCRAAGAVKRAAASTTNSSVVRYVARWKVSRDGKR
jgi:hypothetical protein